MLSLRLPLALAASLLVTGCAFHSTATRWNGRVGPDGRPVFYAATTKVGTNFLIAVPFLGKLSIDGQVDSLTSELEEKGGDHIRIVQGGTENYWYGFPPFTWILTPVVTTLNAEYEPSEEELRQVLREQIADDAGDEELSDAELDARVDAELLRYQRDDTTPDR